MTMFEETCKAAGVYQETIAEEALAEIVNELIFDDTPRTDEEIKKEAVKRFKKLYKI